LWERKQDRISGLKTKIIGGGTPQGQQVMTSRRADVRNEVWYLEIGKYKGTHPVKSSMPRRKKTNNGGPKRQGGDLRKKPARSPRRQSKG